MLKFNQIDYVIKETMHLLLSSSEAFIYFQGTFSLKPDGTATGSDRCMGKNSLHKVKYSPWHGVVCNSGDSTGNAIHNSSAVRPEDPRALAISIRLW